MEKKRGSGLLYLSITRKLLDKIHRGEWKPSQQIPGVRELADSFSTSVKTINRALEELDRRGLIERTQGRGIFLLPQSQWPRQEEAPLICFIPSGGDPVNLALTTSLAEEISRTGGKVIIHTYQGLDGGRPFSRLPQPCRGILAVDFAPPPELFPLLAQVPPELPLLYLGGFSPPSDFEGSYLTWNMEEGLEKIMNYLVNKGHERVGYLGGPLPLNRDPGFLALRRVFHRRGMEMDRGICRATGGYAASEGRRAMEDLIEAADSSLPLPSAFISLYDGTAAGAMGVIHESGRDIPGDIAFVGCENSEVARTIRPALTTLSLERKSAAALAGKLLELSEGGREHLGVTIPLVLEERESSQTDEEIINRWI